MKGVIGIFGRHRARINFAYVCFFQKCLKSKSAYVNKLRPFSLKHTTRWTELYFILWCLRSKTHFDLCQTSKMVSCTKIVAADYFFCQIPILSISFTALRKYLGFRWKTKRKNQWRFAVWRHTIGNSLEESTCDDAEMNRPVGRMDGVEIRRICTFFFAHESNINQTFVFKVFEDFVSWYLLDF